MAVSCAGATSSRSVSARSISTSVGGAIRPAIEGAARVISPHRESIAANLELVAGDLSISKLEDELGSQWARCLDGEDHAFRVISAFHRCIQQAAKAATADIVLVDLGPNLGAINRAALVACRHIVVPVVLWVETNYSPAVWLQLAIYLPLTLFASLFLLQPVKGAVVGVQWALRMHGFDENAPDGNPPV